MDAPRTFGDLLHDAGSARKALVLLRELCMTIGPGVVEHVRMHRVVFGRSMAMRWFADVSPDGDSVIVRLNEGRRAEPSVLTVRAGDDMKRVRDAIAAAYGRV